MDSTHDEELRCMDEYLDDEVELPGFRFHPTDEELVSFYLRRKLDNKPISIELIKQIDIYKYDPWDLPKGSSTGGEKEGYFYCKRGRKYRNSIRPNRVTGSGFWKATGIDKPVYSHGGEGNDCIGLKKTLVYYRGSAGKGAKTEWMMHEFRLPPNTTPQEAEIWTLCRIFKRNASQRNKCRAEYLGGKRHSTDHKSSSSLTVESCNSAAITITHRDKLNPQAYINFGATATGTFQFQEHKPAVINNSTNNDHHRHIHRNHFTPSLLPQPHHQSTAPSSSSSSSALSFWNINLQPTNDHLFAFDDSWDELGSVVHFPF